LLADSFEFEVDSYLLETKKYKASRAKQENSADNIWWRVGELFQPWNTPKKAGVIACWIRSQTSHHRTNNDANIRTHWEK
jgi:hypothetical protein